MAPHRRRNRAQEFEELVDVAPQELDPEVDDLPADSEDDSANEQVNGGREHYEDVGKSKLRKAKEVALGPQYRGSRVSRDAVSADEDEDDPFSRGFDEGSSDDGESEANGNTSPESGEDSTRDESDEDEDIQDGTSDTDLSDNEEEAAARPKLMEQENKSQLRKLVAKDQKSVAASISQANKADAEKGRAVKKQRTTFDSLLNTRIKLQKSLVSINTLVAIPSEQLAAQREDARLAIEAAETAAFTLFSTLTSFRDLLAEHRTGSKRKRPALDSSTPTAELMSHLQVQEQESLPHRNAVLQKWSLKARGISAQPQRGRLNTDTPTTIIDVLQNQLNDTDRLLKRARTPRSCAPLQLSNRVTVDEKIYDDADFYGLLLKELLEQKSADSVAASNVDIDFNNMRREAKAKKNVDTKASKGRKLRYTVHEKLQNFMAPEDRGSWGERQSDELFGSLFGQRMGLREDVGAEEPAVDGQLDEDADGFKLFG